MTVPVIADPAAVSTGPYGAMADAEAASISQIQQNLAAAVLALWVAFGEDDSSFWSGASAPQFATRAATYVVAAQQQVGRVTEQYLRQQFRRMGAPVPAGRIVDLPRDLRLGTEVEEVYQRPVRRVRFLSSQGESIEESVRQATERLERVLEMDLQLAQNTAAQQVMYRQPETITGYRRIIHPELGVVCGLCIAAADRIYSKRELMALHDRCKCTVIGVSATVDPGRDLNAEDLLRLYDAAGSTGAADLKKIRVQVEQNGELGSILTSYGKPYKGTGDVLDQLSDRAREQRNVSIQRQIDAIKAVENRTDWLEDRLAKLEGLAR